MCYSNQEIMVFISPGAVSFLLSFSSALHSYVWRPKGTLNQVPQGSQPLIYAKEKLMAYSAG